MNRHEAAGLFAAIAIVGTVLVLIGLSYRAGYNAALKRETLDNPRVTVQALWKAEVCAEKLETCQCPGP